MSYIPSTRRAWTIRDPYTGPRPDPSQRLISVTNLINPARIVRLTALHRDELPPEEPGTDTWKLLGTAVHAAMEQAAESLKTRLAIREIDEEGFRAPLLVEHRCETTVSVDGIPWTLSGQLDLLEADGVLWDWKVTSAWSVSDGRQGKGEWASQLNVLKWLLERTGTVPRGTVRSLAVWAILRDWSASQSRRDDGYPDNQEVAVPLHIWSDAEVEEYILTRLRAHEAARASLPLCTPAERWAKGGGYAVLRSAKSVRADRILDTREDAERYRDEILSGKGLIEQRDGSSVRCEKYCRVAAFCSQWKKELDTR
jgi:hypothetical protein